MNTAIDFKTDDTLMQDNHVTAQDMEMPFLLPIEEKQDTLEWVCIRLKNPVSLD